MLVPIVVVVAALGLVGTAYAQTETANGTPATAPAVSRRYVVTLLNSFDPIPDRLLPSDLNGLKVYRTQNVVFGKTIYFVRAGFFATSAEANAAKGRLGARFPGAFVTEITEDEYAGVAGTNTRPAPPAASGGARRPASRRRPSNCLPSHCCRAPTVTRRRPGRSRRHWRRTHCTWVMRWQTASHGAP